jgi:GNAT superfamily N-acetyltransferase
MTSDRLMERVSLHEGLERFRDRFPGPHLELVLASMLAGNTAGELWTTRGDPRTLLLWDRGNNVLYLSDDGQAPSLEPLTATILEQIRPSALAADEARFKARALSPSLEERLPSLFPGIDLHASQTLFFVHDATSAPPIPPAVPGMALLTITPEVLAPGALAYGDYVLAEIRSMWPSEPRFHHYGFGTVAVVEGQIICWCTAEYVSPTACGIGIATSPRYGRRGVATATAAHVLQEARARGITACWECARDNLPSVRVAEKLGFRLQSEETYWIGSFQA